MKFFWRYLLTLSALLMVVTFYFLKTDAGQQKIGRFIEIYLSKQTYNKIKVLSLNLKHYPYVVLKLQINDSSNLTLQGRVSNYSIDMHYHLWGEALHFNDFHINDKIDVQGRLSGAFSSLLVTGYGNAFEGKVNYTFINLPTHIKDMHLSMKKVNSKKILNFLEQEPFLEGLASIDMDFTTFSRYQKEGQIKIEMQRAFLYQLQMDTSFILTSTIDFNNLESTYSGEIHSEMGRATLEKGYYHQSKKIAHADYTIHLNDLSYFEKLFKQEYQGILDINGSIMYDQGSESLTLKGDTSQFGGELSYCYEKENLDVTLHAVSLERLLRLFSYPLFISSKLYGTINYNIEEKIALINANLKETRFIHSELTDKLYDALKINLLAHTYNQSYFSGGYQKGLFSSTLKIDNGQEHLYLKENIINLFTDEIYSKFEIKMQGEELYGEIYGTLQNPKLKIDKSKFMKYQTQKHLGSWLKTNE